MDNKKQQKIIVLTICLLIIIPTISYFINLIINLIVPSQFIWDTVAINGMVIFFSIVSFSIVLRNLKMDNIVILFIFFLLFLISFMLFPSNRKYMFSSFTDFEFNGFYRLFLYAMPLYFYLRQVKDYKLLYKYLSITARIGITTGILTYILFITKGGFELQYMVFAYNLLFFTVFCFYDFFQGGRKFSFLLAILGTLVILIGGARGPLICIGSYILLYIIFNFKNSKLKSIIITFCISLFTFFISSNFMEILIKLNSILNKLNINSRTINLLINQEYFDDSGRSSIRSQLIENIEKNPILGNGMFGDRAFTKSDWISNQGTYAHNFIIEILSQYGVILGSIFLIIFFIMIISALLKNQDPLYKNLVLIFIPVGFIKLMLSGSYLNEMYFFLLLAAAINALKRINIGAKIPIYFKK